ncbi:MAG: hypothetical protein QW371_03290 [Candidatus Bathyarchaeia archaeon]
MSEEEVVAIIRRRPDAIIEALGSRPELLAGLMLKLAPWDRFATKEDVRMILEAMEKRFEDLRAYSDRRFEAMERRFEDLMAYSDKRFEDMNKRFEAMDKRFEDLMAYSDKRFEDMNKRFEAIDKRFDDINRRFEDLRYYIDKRIGIVERLLVGFNIPILIAVLATALKAFLG